jgi:hypothetical protein
MGLEASILEKFYLCLTQSLGFGGFTGGKDFIETIHK